MIGNQNEIEVHPLPPFLPLGARVLMLGSFPPPRARWSMDFYYPNMQNDMWRILGVVFFGDKEYFLTEGRKTFCEAKIRLFLEDKGIAVSDTAREVVRHKNNASDQFLEIVKPIALEQILERIPMCRVMITTGQKATDTLLSLIVAEQPKVGGFSEFTFAGSPMRLYRMPSSSRAYPKPLEDKATVYKEMFRGLGLL